MWNSEHTPVCNLYKPSPTDLRTKTKARNVWTPLMKTNSVDVHLYSTVWLSADSHALGRQVCATEATDLAAIEIKTSPCFADLSLSCWGTGPAFPKVPGLSTPWQQAHSISPPPHSAGNRPTVPQHFAATTLCWQQAHWPQHFAATTLCWQQAHWPQPSAAA